MQPRPKQLSEMVLLTNENHPENTNLMTSTGEIFRFFRDFILSIKYEFSRRSDLWNTTATFKYQPTPSF